jgi:hypothetical protein
MVVNPEEMERILRNLFNGGALQRLPKNRRHAEALLALAASSLDSQTEYSEPELNEALADWMAGFTDPIHFDHVTVRRYLVDLAMLLRDAEGSRYRANQIVINRFIEADTRGVSPLVIFYEVQQKRAQRRRLSRS